MRNWFGGFSRKAATPEHFSERIRHAEQLGDDELAAMKEMVVGVGKEARRQAILDAMDELRKDP